MQSYPSIPKIVQNIPIYAFDKLDGSNIRVEWTRKRGFAKFGTRTRLLDENEPILGQAIPLIRNGFADQLERIFRKERYEKATAFFEFYGPQSFAGFHVEDDLFKVSLLDVHIFKKGILTPAEFLKLYASKVETPNMLYHGNANSSLVSYVQDGTLDGMTFEGVICKGGLNRLRQVTMFKIKNRDWLEALKHKCGEDQDLFDKLS